MTLPPPEFSRPIRVDTIGEVSQTIEIMADATERTALARRFGFDAIDHLSGTMTLARTLRGIVAKGRIRAALTQFCVATGDPVPETIDAPFELLFVEETSDAEELELDAEDLDIIDFDGQAVDIGEALAQTVALTIDPFPRHPEADAKLRAAGVISEEEARPLGALAGLKQALEKKRE
ncbi:DUF177 domain-containing protein [Sphingobium boeckii]|uniref:Uncharacterized metal-binding protein YceD (DUF177 family) n=1 Tax=Sphingobium boeckii TaxID=1082345 RepID=A0A7W9AF15_9SPHN|nr:DUF177 domain-containing protein [Sphingobium boeckii]MBB5684226.1 uncharacterized metal-binding protein YceD (DUF177 family) [Sphingobium boeckii]